MKNACEHIKLIVNTFHFFRCEDMPGRKVSFMMPHIEFEGLKYFVNNCPICGKYCRDIEIKEKYFNELKA